MVRVLSPERTKITDGSCPSVAFHWEVMAIILPISWIEVLLDSLGGTVQPSSKGSLSSLKKMSTYLYREGQIFVHAILWRSGKHILFGGFPGSNIAHNQKV